MKNINIINKIIAKKLGKPLNIVEAVNTFYWKTSREKLVECKIPTLFWKHIGSITISKYKVYKEIKRLIKRIRKIRTLDKYSEESKENNIEIVKKRLRQLLYHRNMIATDEYNKRILKINSESVKTLETDINIDVDNVTMETESIN